MPMTRRIALRLGLVALALLPPFLWMAHVGGARWWAIPVEGAPGVSWMVLTDTPEYQVLRDFAAPGATRQMHQHHGVTWHVLTVATGRLRLTIEGEAPVELGTGESRAIRAEAMHSFTNIAETPATIVEVFGKGGPPEGRH